MIIMHLIQLYCDKVTLTGCIVFGLKSFCLAKTLVSLRVTDQMCRENLFFSPESLDGIRQVEVPAWFFENHSIFPLAWEIS